MIEKIAEHIVFNGVKAETIQKVIKSASAIEIYKKNETLIEPQSHEKDVFFILSGVVRLSLFSHDGDVVSYNDVQGKDFFGWLSILDNKERLTSATVQEECQITRIQGKAFKAILFTDEQLMNNFMVRIASVIRDYTQRIEDLSALSVKQRVLNELLKRNQNGDGIVTIGTHEDLASWLGTTRETTSRALKSLENDGVLKRLDHDYQILCSDKVKT